MIHDPWHGTHVDVPDWDRPGFITLLGSAIGLWLIVGAQVRWAWKRWRL